RTPPSALKACVIGTPGCGGSPESNHRVRLRFTPPALGHVALYRAFRFQGATVSVAALASAVPVGTANGNTIVDTEELPNGVQFTYYVKADFDDNPAGPSGASNYVTITAINDAPVAVADSYTAREDTLLTGNNVLDNDTDDDSVHSGLRAVLV